MAGTIGLDCDHYNGEIVLYGYVTQNKGHLAVDPYQFLKRFDLRDQQNTGWAETSFIQRKSGFFLL